MNDACNSYNQSLIDNFNHNFNSFKNNPIALYGVGEKTEIILQLKDKYNIVGLMDSNSHGETIYGFKVLSNEEAARKAEVIIIVANISSCPIIYRRIEFLKEEYGIKIFYLNGFIPQTTENIDSDPYWNKRLDDLYRDIELHDVISFDVFDTLIMRKVFCPTDIFELVEERLKNQYNINIEFKKNRIKAERNCYQKVDKYCDINQIYDELHKLLEVSENNMDKIKKLEFDIEFENCIPRDEMLKSYKYAIDNKKTVYLITDMYWQKQFMNIILESNSIVGYDKLLISCEQKKSKYEGNIWEGLLEAITSNNLLHIGDNNHSDVELPKKYGINTFYVRSSFDIVQNSNLKYIYDSRKNKLTSNLILGKFASSGLNSPFVLSKHCGVLEISTMFDLGFLIFGPLVLNYTLWLIKKCKECCIDEILFFARDGYILKEAYDCIVEEKKICSSKSRYFLTSRRSSSVATIKNEDDIKFIIKNMCKIKKCRIEDIVFRAFGIKMDAKEDLIKDKYYFEITEDDFIQHILGKYADDIFKNSLLERQNYNKYIKNQKINLNANLACVNFVGRGLTQKFIETIIDKDMHGFYFATEIDLKKFFKNTDKIFGLYGEFINSNVTKSHFLSNYLIGEVILSSPDEQLIKFNKEGQPIFNQKDSKRNVALIEQCHRGIMTYVKDFLKQDKYLLDRNFDIKLIDEIYGIVSSNKCIISDEIKKAFLFNDYYDSDSENVYLSY